MKKIRTIILLLMLVLSLILVCPVSAQGPNYLGFTPSSQHVTIGDTLYTVVWADISAGSPIDTAAFDNFSFTPAGIINYTTVVQGDLFSGGFFIDPGSWGTISNESGYATSLVWTSPTNVSDVNRTFVNISWLAAGCGVATINVSAGGTALGGIDPGTTFYEGEVTVHPGAPGGFAATPYNTTQINLTWTMGAGMSQVYIERNSTSSWDRGEGTPVYSGGGINYEDDGLNDGERYYYQAWGYGGLLYSFEYMADDAITFPESNVQPDLPFNPDPENRSKWVEPVYLNCTVTDQDGDSMSVYFYWGNDTLIGSDLLVTNNTVASISIGSLNRYENYSWYVIVNDTWLETQGQDWWFVYEAYPWDINRDSTVNYLDISSLISHYGESGAPDWIRDDVNDDGTINYLDISLLISHYGESY